MSSKLKQCTVLFADDDKAYNDTFAKTLSYFFDKVICAYDGKEAFEKFCKNSCDIVILDMQMPHFDGIEVATKIREKNKNIPIFIVTNFEDFESAVKGYKCNLLDYITKPIAFETLLQTLQKCEELLNLNDLPIRLDGDMYYDKTTKTVQTPTQDKQLTNSESLILEYLLAHKGEVVESLRLENILYETDKSASGLKNVIYKLRQKIGENIISNVSKIGYVLK